MLLESGDRRFGTSLTSLMTSLTWLQIDERALKYTKNKIIKFEGYCIAFAVAVSPNALHIVLEDGQY